MMGVGFFGQNRNPRKHFFTLAEYMNGKRSYHVFVNYDNMFMRCILNQSFLCSPQISIEQGLSQVISNILDDYECQPDSEALTIYNILNDLHILMNQSFHVFQQFLLIR